MSSDRVRIKEKTETPALNPTSECGSFLMYNDIVIPAQTEQKKPKRIAANGIGSP